MGPDSLDDVLAHHGVKGMKWGTRRERSSAVTVKERSGNRTVKTKGGFDRRATVDAKKAATAKQVAKKNSTDALTNKQLEAAIKRMRLEQQFKDLSNPKKSSGREWLEKDLKRNGKQRMSQLSLASKIIKTNLKVLVF